MQSSSEQPLVGEERYVTTLITAAKETTSLAIVGYFIGILAPSVSVVRDGERLIFKAVL